MNTRLMLSIPAAMSMYLTGCCFPGGPDASEHASEVTAAPSAADASPPPAPAPAAPTPAATPPASLPQITASVGLGDSFARFQEKHGPCRGGGGPGDSIEVEPDGTVNFANCSRDYLMVTAPGGVVQSVTLQFEARNEKLSRKEAEITALAHAPNDLRKVRAFTGSMGQDIIVYHSPSLAQNLPSEVWYSDHPVGTFQIILQPAMGERTFIGAVLAAGVDYDENDPGRIE